MLVSIKSLEQAGALSEDEIRGLVALGLLDGGHKNVDEVSLQRLSSRLAITVLRSNMAAPRNASGEPPTGFVYFAWCPVTRLVKIGYSKNPERRISGLNTGSPEKIDLLFTIPGNRADEQRLHKALDSDRHSREWFRPTPALTLVAEMLMDGRGILAAAAAADECFARHAFGGDSTKSPHKIPTAG